MLVAALGVVFPVFIVCVGYVSVKGLLGVLFCVWCLVLIVAPLWALILWLLVCLMVFIWLGSVYLVCEWLVGID